MATLHAKHITFGNYGIVSGDFGSESLSRTQLAKHALSNLSVALNILPKSNWNLSELLKEASKLSVINHPNVAILAEFSSTEDHFYFAFGYDPCLPSLNMVIKTKGSLIEKSALHLSRQIASALVYLSKEQVVVKNLNPDNVLLDNSHCIITNIGPSGKEFQDLGYVAPELRSQNSLSCGSGVDIWSFGALIHMILFGRSPLNLAPSPDSPVQVQICSGSNQDSYTEMAKLSEDCQILLIKCLETDPGQRITIEQLGFDEWISKKGKYPLQV